MALSLTQLSVNAVVDNVKNADISLKTIDLLEQTDYLCGQEVRRALMEHDKERWRSNMFPSFIDINSRRWDDIYIDETIEYGDYFRDIVIVWDKDDEEEGMETIRETTHPYWNDYMDWMTNNEMVDNVWDL
jgi:hypothetical protein